MNDEIVPISVIIPVYNHADELMACLLSLESQTVTPYEVIIVDDASTDGLPERMSHASWMLPVRYWRSEKNAGAPAARNKGFSLSSQPFVLFLDADILLRPSALETFYQALQQHPEAEYVYSSHYFGWKLFTALPFDPTTLREKNYIHTSSLMRREVFPGFDESLRKFQDWDLWLTLCQSGHKGYALQEALFQVKPHKEGMSHWLPSIFYRIPWERIGWMPRELKKYRAAEAIIREKHGI